jgi:uncharacterized protein (TIGR03067 family)
MFSATGAPGEVDKELEKLQGEWTAVYHEFRGIGFKAGEFPAVNFTIKEDKWISKAHPNTVITITLNVSAEPKHFDRKYAGGQFDGKLFLGIYKLEGDTLTILDNTGEKEHPKGFSTKDNSALKLYVFQRTKP